MRNSLFLGVVIMLLTLSFTHSLLGQATDVFEDASEYGYDVKQQSEDEVFFYESRFVDIGLHAGARTFTGGLARLFGTGPCLGGFFTYFFSRSFGLEVTINNSWHQFLIDGVKGTATVFDILARGKYYFISNEYSKALAFANPYIFIGGGQFIRTQRRSDIAVSNSTSGPGIELGGGFEIPLKEHQVFLGIKPSYQMVFFADESDYTRRGTSLSGDLINFVVNLTYSF